MRLLGLFLAFLGLTTALYSPSDKVVVVDDASLSKLVKANEPFIIEFYAEWCGHCKAFTSDYAKAAAALHGIVKVVAIDADQNRGSASQYGIQGFPTVKFFDTKKMIDYQGQRTAQGVVDFAFQQVQALARARLSGKASTGSNSNSGNGKGVVTITAANWEQEVMSVKDQIVAVAFISPQCGHCHRLQPHWDAAASQLSGTVKLARIDATVETNLAHQYGFVLPPF